MLGPKHKYVEIKSYILDNINSGKYLAGEKIESESTLQGLFSVSRMTVRQAINELQNENILVSIKGKGTFVKSDDQEITGGFLLSFSEISKLEGKVVSNRTLEFSQIISSEYLNIIFGFSSSVPLWYFKRLRLNNDLPVALEESYIPIEVAPNLNITHLEHSLFDYLENETGIILASANQKTMAVLADEFVAKTLEIPVNTPLIKIIQRSFDYQNRCIEISNTYYHPTNAPDERTVLRKKIDFKKETLQYKIGIMCENGTISAIIAHKINDIHTFNGIIVSATTLRITEASDVVAKFNIVLIDPRDRFMKEKLISLHPDTFIQEINSQDFAKMDADNILRTAISSYSNFIKNK